MLASATHGGMIDTPRSFIDGVDGSKKRCRMGGSPGTKGSGAIIERMVGRTIFDSVRR